MLHGQPGAAGDWDRVIAAIGDRVPALAIDRPGYDGELRPGGFADNARAVIERMDSDRIARATVVGLSFGAGVAAWLAAFYPDRVERAVLISPAATTDSLVPSDRLLAAPLIGPMVSAAVLATTGIVSLLPPARHRIATAWGLSEPYVRRAGARLLSPTTFRAFMVEQRALFKELPILEDALPRIIAPTTIVIGTRDAVVPPASNRRLAQMIGHSRLIEVEGAGHTLTATHPAQVAQAIVTAVLGSGAEQTSPDLAATVPDLAATAPDLAATAPGSHVPSSIEVQIPSTEPTPRPGSGGDDCQERASTTA